MGSTPTRFTVCPFCGVVSESAHDSQQACIQALQSEIERTRQVLIRVGELSLPEGPHERNPPVEEDEPEQC
jgi:hypothetical protein